MYCKNLTNVFRASNQDVVFFETAMNFKHYPHMTIHCVPLPFENGNLAPIYFKKAILESEKEWAQNKQLIDVSKFNVKRVIPRGLPYFVVNFGLDYGFAHVIEDENNFPKNFAQVRTCFMNNYDPHKLSYYIIFFISGNYWRHIRFGPSHLEKTTRR